MENSSRDKIVQLAQEELKRQGIDPEPYVLEQCAHVAGGGQDWEIIFSIPDMEDARIRMVINEQTGEISEFRSSWA